MTTTKAIAVMTTELAGYGILFWLDWRAALGAWLITFASNLERPS